MTEVKYNKNHYEIWLNNMFYCSCDNMTEVKIELELLEM